jgi:hypothetical protein
MLRKHCPAIFWTLIASVVACPTMVRAQSPDETAGTAVARKPDLDYITPNAFAAAVVYPRSVLKSPRLEYLPVEILSTAVKQALGLDPVEIEQLIVVAEPPKSLASEGPPPELAVVLKMASPVAGEVFPALARRTTEGKLDGKTYRKAMRPDDASIYQADEKTLIIGTDSMLRKIVANHAAPAEGRLKTMLRRCGTPDALCMILVEPLRPALAALENAPLPPPLADLRTAPKLIDYIAFRTNVCDSLDATLIFRATDEAAAKQLGGIIDGLMTMAQQAADVELAKQESSRDPVQQATAKYSKRMSRRFAEILRPVQKGAMLTTTLSPAVLFPPPSAETIAGLAAKKPDLDYITADAAAGAILYPQSALKRSPLAEYLPLEILSAAGKAYLGLDPVDIEQAIAVAELPAGGQPGGAIVLKMARPIAGNEVLPMLAGMTEEGNLDGKTYRKGKSALNPSIYQTDERTLIVGTDAMLRKVVAAHAAPAEGKLKTMLGRCGTPDMLLLVMVEPIQPALAGMAQGPLAPAMGSLGNVLKLVNYVAYKANVYDPLEVTVAIRAKDESAAEQIEEMYKGAMAVQQQGTMAVIGQLARSHDPSEQALARYAKRLSATTDGGAAPVRKGATLTLSGVDRSTGAGFAVGLLLPAVQSAREAGRRAQSLNNLHQIALATQNYNATLGSFPPRANFDAQGKPLLSWRVHILPYIEENELYKQFHLDQPWDSEHNRPLIAKMPKIFQNPSSPGAKPGMANYLAVCGKGLMFDGTAGRKPADVTDGLSKTIMVVEADDKRAVEWTKPQDWEFDDKQPLAGLGHAHPAGFGAAFGDGSVRFLSSSIDATLFQALLTIAGGEAVQAP